MDSVLQLNNSKYTSRLMQILFNDGTYAPALFDSICIRDGPGSIESN